MLIIASSWRLPPSQMCRRSTTVRRRRLGVYRLAAQAR
jgi:hypothetical protein